MVAAICKQDFCIIEAEVREKRGALTRIAQTHWIKLALANKPRPTQKEPPEHPEVFHRKSLE
jgi:hypothetical protein